MPKQSRAIKIKFNRFRDICCSVISRFVEFVPKTRKQSESRSNSESECLTGPSETKAEHKVSNSKFNSESKRSTVAD